MPRASAIPMPPPAFKSGVGTRNASRRSRSPTTPPAATARPPLGWRELYLLDTRDAGHRRLYLLALLEETKHRTGLDRPLPTDDGTPYAAAAAQGADVIEDLLAYAVAERLHAAAAAAAQILGQIGHVDMLTRGGSVPTPLVAAATHSDRRLAMAAIDSVMKLDPTEPFPSASQVIDDLGFFARSYGVPRVLVVHPRSDEAARSPAWRAASDSMATSPPTAGRRSISPRARPIINSFSSTWPPIAAAPMS